MILFVNPSLDGLRINPGRFKTFQHPVPQAALRRMEIRDAVPMISFNLPLNSVHLLNSWSSKLTQRKWKQVCGSGRNHQFRCHCFLNTGPSFDANFIKNVTLTLTRSCNCLQGRPLEARLISSIGIIVFAIWGLVPLMRLGRRMFLKGSDGSWKSSGTYQLATSYIRPLLLWAGAFFVCRSLDLVILPTEAAQNIKNRSLHFVRSLSTVLAFAVCMSSATQQALKFFTETSDSTDTKNAMGYQFAGNFLYVAVWVVAVTLFLEMLGFSTQKWLTAGGFGTVLLTLAGREIFTNFLSSAMIHATRPFTVNEWIQTKIEGYDVSGTIERVGWWGPTIVRGEDREAVHIPNHKFTVNVVRNLSQKKHWRIKTHLCISHLDVGKINIIVADMRKVLSKNQLVEQQKLHRRVFLDNIDPENQALMILVSCFVKTSHVEEYLCVKEAILLDLLRVIRHHRARLATPIRTFQRLYASDQDDAQYAESTFSHGTVSKNQILLVEPTNKSNVEEKTKSHTLQAQADENHSINAAKSAVDAKADVKDEGASINDSSDSESKSLSEPKTDEMQSSDVTDGSELVNMPKLEANDDQSIAVKSSPEPKTSNSAKPLPKVDSKPSEEKKQRQVVTPETKSTSQPEVGARRLDNNASHPSPSKQDTSLSSKSALKENIVLNVALEGSKRTLPIDETTEPPSNLEDTKELAPLGSGNSTAVAEKDNDKA